MINRLALLAMAALVPVAGAPPPNALAGDRPAAEPTAGEERARLAMGDAPPAGAEFAVAGQAGRYAIDDVKSVTKRDIDPIPAAADDEFTQYTITLKNGTVHVARVSGMMRRRDFENIFRATGYSGSIAELMAHQ